MDLRRRFGTEEIGAFLKSGINIGVSFFYGGCQWKQTPIIRRLNKGACQGDGFVQTFALEVPMKILNRMMRKFVNRTGSEDVTKTGGTVGFLLDGVSHAVFSGHKDKLLREPITYVVPAVWGGDKRCRSRCPSEEDASGDSPCGRGSVDGPSTP